MPRNQAMFRGRKENGFQLILVDASFKKKEIIQSSLSGDRPAGATFHVTKHIVGSVITTLLIHQCYPRALSSNAIPALIVVTNTSRQFTDVHILIFGNCSYPHPSLAWLWDQVCTLTPSPPWQMH